MDGEITIFDYTREQPPGIKEPGFYIEMPKGEEDEVMLVGPHDSMYAAQEALKAMVLKSIAASFGIELKPETEVEPS